jgi:hypothetical protein
MPIVLDKYLLPFFAFLPFSFLDFRIRLKKNSNNIALTWR